MKLLIKTDIIMLSDNLLQGFDKMTLFDEVDYTNVMYYITCYSYIWGNLIIFFENLTHS
jgi:hypothetical protein